eukprot:9495342-Ditylum_brightwellii.AAC.1
MKLILWICMLFMLRTKAVIDTHVQMHPPKLSNANPEYLRTVYPDFIPLSTYNVIMLIKDRLDHVLFLLWGINVVMIQGLLLPGKARRSEAFKRIFRKDLKEGAKHLNAFLLAKPEGVEHLNAFCQQSRKEQSV